MAGAKLTEAEREALKAMIRVTGSGDLHEALAAFEAIVTARVAAALGEVEALLNDELAAPSSNNELADAIRIVREVRGEVGD